MRRPQVLFAHYGILISRDENPRETVAVPHSNPSERISRFKARHTDSSASTITISGLVFVIAPYAPPQLKRESSRFTVTGL